MNTRGNSRVERAGRIAVYVIEIAMSLGATAGVGCVDVEGGAVELSWSVRDTEGVASSCRIGGADLPELSHVRICWQPLEEDGELTEICIPQLSERFRCELEHGVTGFEIDPGETAVWIEPLCEDGSLPRADAYEVPAPIVRTIESGSVATLSALLIVAAPNACQR